jgi:hypothetical protein
MLDAVSDGATARGPEARTRGAGATDRSGPLEQSSRGWSVRERKEPVRLRRRGLRRALVEDPARLRGDERNEQRGRHGRAGDDDCRRAVVDAAAGLIVSALMLMPAARRRCCRMTGAVVCNGDGRRSAHSAQSVHLAGNLALVAEHHRAQQSEEEGDGAEEAE